MIKFISNWSESIIVAVVITIIIEMILPKGSIKKYIKVVLGLYILFTIISPAINKIVNKNEMSELFDLETYAKEIENSDSKYNKILESNNSNTIKDIYINNLKSDIKSKLKNKNYYVKSIYITAKDDKNYAIEQIGLSVDKLKDKKEDNSNINNVNIEIDIKENNEIKNYTSNNKIGEDDKKTIVEYITNEYGIDKNKILII